VGAFRSQEHFSFWHSLDGRQDFTRRAEIRQTLWSGDSCHGPALSFATSPQIFVKERDGPLNQQCLAVVHKGVWLAGKDEILRLIAQRGQACVSV
jgi:hypothetical protein